MSKASASAPSISGNPQPAVANKLPEFRPAAAVILGPQSGTSPEDKKKTATPKPAPGATKDKAKSVGSFKSTAPGTRKAQSPLTPNKRPPGNFEDDYEGDDDGYFAWIEEGQLFPAQKPYHEIAVAPAKTFRPGEARPTGFFFLLKAKDLKPGNPAILVALRNARPLDKKLGKPPLRPTGLFFPQRNAFAKQAGEAAVAPTPLSKGKVFAAIANGLTKAPKPNPFAAPYVPTVSYAYSGQKKPEPI